MKTKTSIPLPVLWLAMQVDKTIAKDLESCRQVKEPLKKKARIRKQQTRVWRLQGLSFPFRTDSRLLYENFWGSTKSISTSVLQSNQRLWHWISLTRLFLHIELVWLPDSRWISSISWGKLLFSHHRRYEDLHRQLRRQWQQRKLSKKFRSSKTSKRSSTESKLQQTSS